MIEKNTIQNICQRSGPVGVLLGAFLLALLWLSLARVALVAMHWDRLTEVADVWKIFVIGIRMDTIMVCQLLVIPTALYLLLPGKVIRQH